MSEAKDNVTETDAATYPRPCTAIPTSVRFSPDGSFIGFLHSGDGSLTQQFFSFDLETKTTQQYVQPPDEKGNTEANLSLEEKLRRERQRQLGVGVTSYLWTSCDGAKSRLLIPLRGNLYLQDDEGPLRLLLVSKEENGWMPDGRGGTNGGDAPRRRPGTSCGRLERPFVAALARDRKAVDSFGPPLPPAPRPALHSKVRISPSLSRSLSLARSLCGTCLPRSASPFFPRFPRHNMPSLPPAHPTPLPTRPP